MRGFAIAALLLGALAAQGTPADYARAAGLAERWRGKLREFHLDLHWLPDGGGWFVLARADGGESYVRIAPDGSLRNAATAAELGLDAGPHRLAPQTRSPRARRLRSRDGGGATTVTFENHGATAVALFWLDGEGARHAYGELAPGATRTQGTFAGHLWLGEGAEGPVGVFVAEATPGVAVFDAAARTAANAPPDDRAGADEARADEARPFRTFVRDHDVFGRARGGGDEFRLSTDGTAGDPYEVPRHWSPDGTKVLGFRVEPGEHRVIHLIESTPKDQLQPKVHDLDYAKPGDRIDRPRPRLFDLAARRQVPIDDAPFADAWSIDHVHWAPDGHEVYCLYNRRGHQVLSIVAIDAATGALRTVLEERSDTFVDYSQKTFLHWLDATGELLWASERDGWNHLYRVDLASGAIAQVTKGDWLVRGVELVDEAAREIWFSAGGIHPEQDPYHVHLARVGFDGQGLTVLTEGDGTHTWELSPQRTLLIDRWSRVDLPQVTELRDARDGRLLAELGRDDASALVAAGFRAPERFVAKGRDGVTDIHGILIRPSTYDPLRVYPVIEAIYAGPQGQFVPKSFGLGLRQRQLAELGFVVVQIDGMGTNWRSKAFHDVCWRNLADSGLPDRIAWLRAAKAAYPNLDLSRVGIYGGSAGGQSALAALLHHGDFYRAAAADCGCHDNRMDKIWWNEAWMGWPIGDWYAENANATHAARLQGKLLLTVGELDRNVDPASTMQVAAALIAAGKDFEFVVVPGGGHGVGETPYLARRRQDFFVRHLLAVEPPAR